MDINNGIGKNNVIPWHLSSDLKRFKKLTMGHHIIMGRKTYESIARQLPGRKMLILSTRPAYEVIDGLVFNSILDAVEYSEKQGESELFIIGGGEVFKQSIKLADRIYLTIVEASVDADTFFPDYDEEEWQLIAYEDFNSTNGDQYPYKYKILERKAPSKSQLNS